MSYQFFCGRRKHPGGIEFGCSWKATVLAAGIVLAVCQTVNAVGHPLDPLTPAELRQVITILKTKGSDGRATRFGLIALHEPDKKAVLMAAKKPKPTRQAYALLYDWDKRRATEVVVDVKNAKVLRRKHLDHGQPPLVFLTVSRLQEIVFADKRWQSSLKKRGIQDSRYIKIWPDVGQDDPLKLDNSHYVTEVVVLNNDPGTMAKRFMPIDMLVDLSAGKILRYADRGKPGTDEAKTIYQRTRRTPQRQPLSITQSKGPGFSIKGSQITWQNWRFRVGVHPRRGLELYDVAYHDNGNRRSILYRAFVSEMVTPYGDPDWYNWYPSDEGDLNLANYGLMSAVHGEDTPPNTHYIPAVVHDHQGKVINVSKAVAVYERDGGMLWRHAGESRRARDLVVASHYMIDNYDYVLEWIFREDGRLEAKVILSGMINFGRVQQNKVEPEDKDASNTSHTLVAPGFSGPIHQHIFNFRLDFDVDGLENSVAEMNSKVLEQKSGDYRPWFQTTATLFREETQAKRHINVATSRWWKVFNPNQPTNLGHYPAYGLFPGTNMMPLPGPRAPSRRKMGFMEAHLWVTPHRKNELYAGGRFFLPGVFGKGLPRWTAANRQIDNRDVVVWYTLGVTHLPRPEDWPVMPAMAVSFVLKPFGFFNENPAMDVSAPHPW